jgi:hypothetical protein
MENEDMSKYSHIKKTYQRERENKNKGLYMWLSGVFFGFSVILSIMCLYFELDVLFMGFVYSAIISFSTLYWGES